MNTTLVSSSNVNVIVNMTSSSGNTYDVAVRAQVVTLKHYTNLTNDRISSITGVGPRQIALYNSNAKHRGYKLDQPLLSEYVEDAKRTGSARKGNDEKERAIVAHVQQSRATRGHNLHQIAQQSSVGLARKSVQRVLKSQVSNKVKRTKPSLTQKQKDARLAWYLKHQYWTLDDWKQMLFSDETSVICGHRCGADNVW